MIQTDIKELKKDLSHYIEQVETGEIIIVCDRDKPLAEIKPLKLSNSEPRPFGLCAGDFLVPDDFDEPLPDNNQYEFNVNPD